MKRIVLICAIVLVSALVLGLGARWAVYGRFIQKTDNAFVKADTIVISAKTPGRIAEVLVVDNAVVNKGDPLVRVEINDYSARVRQANADREARRAAVETADNQVALNEAKVADAAASVKRAEAELNLNQLDYNRTAELVKENFATRQALDQRTSALKAGKARLDSAHASLDAANAESSVLKAQSDEARAALAWGEAALELAEIDEANAVIRAPNDGVVGNVSVRAGEYASTGRQLMVLVPISEAYIVANFKETQVARIEPGEKVRIEIDAYPGAEIVGVVDSLAPSSGAEFSLLPPENATGNFTKIVQRVPVKILIAEAPEHVALLPGLSVTASIDTRGANLNTVSRFAPREAKDSVAQSRP
ncbi:MAG: HlyD family secretion protein [Parvularculaceae bacterium]